MLEVVCCRYRDQIQSISCLPMSSFYSRRHFN